MRRPVGVLAVALIALLAWFAFRGARESVSEVARTTTAAPVQTVEGTAPLVGVGMGPESDSTVLDFSARSAVGGKDQTAATGSGLAQEVPLARLHGRVLDDSGRPLPSADAVLTCAGNDWREGVELSQVDWCGRRMFGFAAPADAMGYFALEVPLPSSDWVMLFVGADALHGTHVRHFGLAGGRDQGLIVAGDNALGDIVLPQAGCILGRIVDESGQPISRVLASAEWADSRWHESAISADDGSFRIERVPLGRIEVRASGNGYLTSESHVIDLVAAQVFEGLDLVLPRAPSIEGIVVDEASVPLTGVRLLAWPAGGGAAAMARSGEDGRFVMHLPLAAPYGMDFHHPGFLPYGGLDPTARELHQPGTRNLRLVLVRASVTEFIVLDAANGAPVERYGLAILPKPDPNRSSSAERDAVEPRDAPGGRLRLPADPALHWYHVEAPGFAPQEGPVRHDHPSAASQTLRLTTGGRVRGRVVANGTPIAHAALHVERQPIKIDPDERDELESEIWFSDNYRFDLSEFLGRVRTSYGQRDGGFEIADLPSGTFRLVASGSGGVSERAEHLRVEAGRTLEIGDLQLGAPSSVSVRVLVAPGRSPAGLLLSLDREPDDHGFGWADNGTGNRGFQLEESGFLRIDGLEAGPHRIHVADRPNVCIQADPLVFDLIEHEQKELVWDLEPFCPSQLCVRVREAGTAVVDARVSWRSERLGRDIGTVDENGEACGQVSGTEPLKVKVDSSRGLPLARRILDAPAIAGEDRLVEIDLACGQLVLEIDPALELSSTAGLGIALHRQDGSGLAKLYFRVGEFFPHAQELLPVDRRLELGRIEPGTWRIQLEVHEFIPPGQWRVHEAAPIDVVVEAGRETRCTLDGGR